MCGLAFDVNLYHSMTTEFVTFWLYGPFSQQLHWQSCYVSLAIALMEGQFNAALYLSDVSLCPQSLDGGA